MKTWTQIRRLTLPPASTIPKSLLYSPTFTVAGRLLLMSKDNPQEMESAHKWLVGAAAELGLEKHEATELTRELLALTKDVAHERSRPAAPLTAYLVGLASANGDEARAHVEKLRAIIASGSDLADSESAQAPESTNQAEA